MIDIGIGTPNPVHKLDVDGDVQAHNFFVGDLVFQNDGQQMWRTFEDESDLYVESLLTGKLYRFMLQEVEGGR